MTEVAEKLKAELAQLSEEERAEIAHFLLHTLDVADEEVAWEAELDARMDDIRNGKEIGEPIEKLFEEMREKYS